MFFHCPKSRHSQGFTLIELSIVLVIIGLIVGGVLVGQDLIRASQVRAQLSDLQQFSTATNTFKLKYNALPGDMLDADQFGLTYQADGSTLGARGDGKLTHDADLSEPLNWLSRESHLFFIQLSDAGLVSGEYAWQSATYNYCDADGYSKQFPKMQIGNGGVYALTQRGRLWFGLSLNQCSLGTNLFRVSQMSTGSVLKPMDAYTIDSKIDDGVPGTGSVIAIESWNGTLDNNVAGCVVDATSAAYNVTDEDFECRIWVRAQ